MPCAQCTKFLKRLREELRILVACLLEQVQDVKVPQNGHEVAIVRVHHGRVVVACPQQQQTQLDDRVLRVHPLEVGMPEPYR